MAVSGMFVFMVTASLCGRPAPLPRRTLNADTTLPVRGNQDGTEMELSCPHDRPRSRHRGPAGGGIEEGRRQKSWPAGARKRELGYSVCVDALSAAILHWPASAVSWQEELSPG